MFVSKKHSCLYKCPNRLYVRYSKLFGFLLWNEDSPRNLRKKDIFVLCFCLVLTGCISAFLHICTSFVLQKSPHVSFGFKRQIYQSTVCPILTLYVYRLLYKIGRDFFDILKVHWHILCICLLMHYHLEINFLDYHRYTDWLI